MSQLTTRDRIWSAALELATGERQGVGHFNIDSVLRVAGLEEQQRRTATRVLGAMRELGWIEPAWSRGYESSGTEQVLLWQGTGRIGPGERGDVRGDIFVEAGTSVEHPEDLEPVEPEADRSAVTDAVYELDIPGSAETLQRRREAVVTVVERILESGGAWKKDLLDEIDGEALGYGGGEKNTAAESAWRNCLQPALKSHPAVEATGSSGRWVPA